MCFEGSCCIDFSSSIPQDLLPSISTHAPWIVRRPSCGLDGHSWPLIRFIASEARCGTWSCPAVSAAKLDSHQSLRRAWQCTSPKSSVLTSSKTPLSSPYFRHISPFFVLPRSLSSAVVSLCKVHCILSPSKRAFVLLCIRHCTASFLLFPHIIDFYVAKFRTHIIIVDIVHNELVPCRRRRRRRPNRTRRL